MNKDLKRLVRLLLVALLCASCNQGVVRTLVEPKVIQAASAEQPKNIILFIGDGMGFESVRSASLYKSGRESSLCFQSFPHQAGLTHNNASGGTTDSAAAATAIATGVKVHNSVLSLALPGDGREVTTLLEVYQGKGKQVGLVTTSHIEDATPAAFAAHQPTRRLHRQIATDLLETRPHLLMGAYLAVTPEVAAGKGYQVVESSEEMEAVGADLRTPLAGLFRYGKLPYEFDAEISEDPDLSEMTAKALELLSSHPEGFFLMVESENIDESGHANHLQRHVGAVLEFDQAVQEAVRWVDDRTDTLILVTSDHETGGLSLIADRGEGQYPEVRWSTTGHTQTPVPLYAVGPLSEAFGGVLDNTDIFKILTAADRINLEKPQPSPSPSSDPRALSSPRLP